MGETNNVFISWSGERSKGAAEALREWLPIVLQAAKPWMSEADIEKGSRGLDEIGRALEAMKVGIICLTPENLAAEWILYEAGALSKTPDAKARVCTYLLASLKPQDVKAPLGMFQWTRANREDTRKLIHTINKHLDATSVPEKGLNALFDKMWPDLEAKLATLPDPPGIVPPTRSTEEMVAEILELNRSMASEIQGIARESEATRQVRGWRDAIYNSVAGRNPVWASETDPAPARYIYGLGGSIGSAMVAPSAPNQPAVVAPAVLPSSPAATESGPPSSPRRRRVLPRKRRHQPG
jgi:hypothetical protein